MPLAIFDLDNTLLGGDSDHLWGQFLVDEGIVDGDYYARENDRYYYQYRQGTLDIREFLAFTLQPLATLPPAQLMALRQRFLDERIETIMLPKAAALIADHRARGHRLMIITATNAFITRPIADRLGIETLIATEPEMADGRYTGRVDGTPCFREGKVERLHAWLRRHGENLAGAWFYTDSHNDLPLLEEVSHPVAVDPDDTLQQHAEMKGWPVITLR